MVLNRIEQREREVEEQRRKEKLKRQADDLTQRQAANKRHQDNLRLQAEARHREDARRQLVRTNSDYVFNSSGALQGLKDIERGKLSGNVTKHALLINLDNSEAQLVWGNKFSIKDNRVDYIRPFIGYGVKNYQSITVKVNPDTFSLSIQGSSNTTFTQNEWKNNPGRVLDMLADAYINPQRVNESDEPPPSSSSYSSGSQAEC